MTMGIAPPQVHSFSPLTKARRDPASSSREGSLGLVLVQAGLIDEEELRSALTEQANEAARGHWVLIGDVLQRWHLITSSEVATSVSTQTRRHASAHFAQHPHAAATSVVKRGIDIAGALVGLAITATILPAIALAISLEDDGPVLFRQTRVGLRGRQFGILKFRTMVPDADRRKLSITSKSPQFFSAANDTRITNVGRVLRKTLLDELPQFWNVLVGEMSLVGTRPPTLDEVWHYEQHHWSRLEVKAGMTGLWQVCEDRHERNFEEVVKLDSEYGERWSLALDALILAKTVGAALGKLRQA
jgi:lipopolysaccharide/colanic/teichoic acid biosynthesis glycosyltransferase